MQLEWFKKGQAPALVTAAKTVSVLAAFITLSACNPLGDSSRSDPSFGSSRRSVATPTPTPGSLLGLTYGTSALTFTKNKTYPTSVTYSPSLTQGTPTGYSVLYGEGFDAGISSLLSFNTTTGVFMGAASFTPTTIMSAKTVTITANDTVTLSTSTTTIAVAVEGTSAGSSTVATSAATVIANNTTTATITVTLKSSTGEGVPGQLVTLTSVRGLDTIAPASAGSDTTDASGVATFTVKSAEAGSAQLVATDSTDTVVVTQTTTVTFVSDTPATTFSSIAATGSTVVGSSSTVTITIRDPLNNPIVGIVPIFSASGTGNTVGACSASNASGISTCTLSSTVAGVKNLAITSPAALTSETTTATFTAGAVSLSQSTVTLSAASVASGGTVVATLTALDAYGNPVSSGLGAVVFTPASHSTGSFSGTAVQSTNTFTDTFTASSAGSVNISATIGGSALTSAAAALTVTASGATKLAFTTAPSATGTAGSNLGTQPVVTIQDSGSNTVTGSSANVTLAVYSDSACTVVAATTPDASSSIAGTATLAATSGVATFAGIKINLAQSALYLKASSGALTTACSSLINVSPGAYDVTKSEVTAASASVTSGSAVVATLTAKDAYGNLNPSGLPAVGSIAFTSSVVGGTGTFGAITGVYTSSFTGVLAGSVTLGATISGAAVSNNASVTVNASSINSLEFTTSPSTTGNADTALASQPVIAGKDANGNTVSSYASAVTLSAYSDTSCAVSVASGLSATTNPVTASSGVATFAGLTILKTNVQSIKADDGTRSVCFNTLAISAGAAASVAISSGDAQSGTAGSAITSFVAIVKDLNNNVKSGSTVSWAVTAGGGSLSSASNSSDTSGLSSSTLTLGTTAGANTVTATVGALTPATFNATGTAGAATKLAFTTHPPATGTVGTNLSAQPVVTVQDANNNTVTTSTDSVTLAVYSNSNCSTAAATAPDASSSIAGTATVNAISGVTTFAGIKVNLAQPELYLRASSGALTTACSSAINVSAGTLSDSVSTFTVSGSVSSIASGATATLLITPKDAFGNVRTGVVTASNSGGTSTGTYAATTGPSSGVYSIVFTGGTAGTATTITAEVGGVSLTATQSMTVTGGGPSTPTITSVSAPSNGTYVCSGGRCDQLIFSIDFSEAVTVTGTPQFVMNLGGFQNVYANYSSGSGSTTLNFMYELIAADFDSDGMALSSFQLNGGTIKSGSNVDADLTMSLPDISGILVTASDVPSTTLDQVNNDNSREVSSEARPTSIVYFMSGGRLVCAGSVIDVRYVLIAAHCVDGLDPASTSVWFGSVRARDGTSMAPRSFIVHPSYDSRTGINDIALIEFSSDVRYDSDIGAADILSSAVREGDRTVAYSWEGASGITFGSIHFTEQVALADSAPSDYYATLFDPRDTNFLALTTASGSAGNGAMIYDRNGMLVGLGNYSPNHFTSAYPTVVTRVREYVAWISSYATGASIK
jgi:hypothetical protein